MTATSRIGRLKLRDTRWYGCRPDTADQRDFLFSVEHNVMLGVPLPEQYDLRNEYPARFSLPYDQGQLGSCVGNGCGFIFDYEQRKQNEPGYTPSRLFIYYNGRAIEQTIKSDSGIEIRDGIKAMAKLGAPRETAWPYKITKFATKPTTKVYTAGKKRLALKYSRVENRGSGNQMRAAVAGGLPVVIGISVYESFESAAVAKTGIVPMPSKSENMLGGHCMVAVGYRDASGGGTEFIVRNSWGTSWGDKGYCYIPEAYLTNSDLASDFWCVSIVA